MRSRITILFLIFYFFCMCLAGSEEKIQNPSVDKLFLNVSAAYQAESEVMLRSTLWFNSPQISEILNQAKLDFERYDTISLVIKPLSTTFYKKFGYERIAMKAIEEFKGIDIKNGSVQETNSQSTLDLFIDEVGNYWILKWNKIPMRPMIKMNKESNP